MIKVAVMGASGFVGSRILEMFHLGGQAEIRPIVRSFGGLARVARFNLDWHLADACDEAGLTNAFRNCDCVVHSVFGTSVIEGSIAPTYRAAERAGVRRLVYLSTASVHGQAPQLGTDEDSVLSDRQPQEYNNQKVRAERLLLKEREGGSVEVVILRPGIVFGPRDRWISTLADELLRGTAYLVEGGSGICNSIYVDNLVHAIQLGLSVEGTSTDGEAFLVGDEQTVTWAELYKCIADGLGVPFENVHQIPAPAFLEKWSDRVSRFRSLNLTQAILPLLPTRLKRVANGALAAYPEPIASSPWSLSLSSAPGVTPEMADLHRCRFKFPLTKAKRLLGYDPIVSFQEGCRRSVHWLRFAGYPVCPITTSRLSPV